MTKKTVKHFVDEGGRYIGQFVGAEPPQGAVEVALAPDDGHQLWVDGAWSAPPVTFSPLTRFQFEVILELLGINQSQVFALIDGLPWTDMEKIIAKKKVETGGNDGRWSRENSLWDLLGPSLGISKEQIDEKWLEAQAL
ncbi:hypothetical protein [Cohaesibacter gelatinilyticus]|uniref:Uncharacterized protein n=1 Tax=Cohaesibacter gelatinilyticus TaxID=372072 RepID=A0A285PKD3_9HYPH|nr:hypothetical protein [Cohaesibacter gelatinilyticus]SNZ21737.1 hypothetical protein SAMN06265368_4862 [Cohaesibacter gelatinilyticus]